MAALSAIIVVFGRKNPSTPQWKLSDGVLNDPKAILLADLVCSPAIAKKSGVNAAFTFGAA